ncbi:filamin A-interacting protein 1-like [Pituophis catenifer annectens]|uniref:filamin A-interacting protein 1-like n=1 Tax=Pituophis catenifer annectens TaxID=94852 RepID=UPI003991C5C2
MYSGNNNTESSIKLKHCQQKPNVNMEDSEEKKKMKRRQTKRNYVAEKDTILTSPELNQEQKKNSKKGEDLSRDDLLFLLSVLEGELQAQDEVIGVLKAEKINLALLEGQYGFVTPKKVLEALQRDAIQTKTTLWQEDIYEKPMGELDKLVEKHKETHRRMLGQLLMVEKSHRQTLYDLEDEKRKHSEYMEKSDEFTNLLEQEQERITTPNT